MKIFDKNNLRDHFAVAHLFDDGEGGLHVEMDYVVESLEMDHVTLHL